MAAINKVRDVPKTLLSCIKSGIHSSEDATILRENLEKIDRATLQSWNDDDDHDILHHAIIAGNIEAVSMIFAMGLFKPPHEPKSFPYIHVACVHGNKGIVSLLLQERPNDNKVIKFTKREFASRPGRSHREDEQAPVTPLDIAALNGHVNCVVTLLDFCHKKSSIRAMAGVDNHLCQACLNKSPHALRLLLSQNPKEEDIKAAVGCALKVANAECLDVLLKFRTNVTTLFERMNLYHVLYSYSSSFNKEWYEALLTVTSVLLKHGHNVRACIPFRTYPLYSLLSHSSAHDFEHSAPYLISCLLVLLKAGADPNFNEDEMEKEFAGRNVKTAFGRSAFPSAFHCIYDSILTYSEQHENIEIFLRRYLLQCLEILLRHNANPNQVGPVGEREIGGSALHGYLYTLPVVGIQEKTINGLKLLLRSGADSDVRYEDNYPVNLFCVSLLEKNFLEKAKRKPKIGETIQEVLALILDTMSFSSLNEAYMTMQSILPSNPEGERLLTLNDIIRKEFNVRTGFVWTLKKFSELTILKSCGRRAANILKLPLPMTIKSKIGVIA